MAGRACRICGKLIEGRRGNAIYCCDCAIGVRKGYYQRAPMAKDSIRKNRANRIKELEARDTLILPIQEKRTNSLQTGKDHVYLLCPACNCVLNKADRFCRFCGQRVKED